MEKKKLASLFSLYFFVWGMNHHILRSAPDNSCMPFYLYILELRVSPCPEIVFHSIIAKSFIPKGIRSQWESERERGGGGEREREKGIRDRTKFSFTWSACRCWRYMVGLFVEWMKEWNPVIRLVIDLNVVYLRYRVAFYVAFSLSGFHSMFS